MTIFSKDTQTHWAFIEPFLSIRNEREYELVVARPDELLDKIGDNEKHPLYSLLDVLSIVIEAYDEEHYPESSLFSKQKKMTLKKRDIP
ncbi:MAG: hypothetical protein HZB19_06330 [Chloroflexi bacterium]|nr:hypothetical protein [Chloroflexota bacterium]